MSVMKMPKLNDEQMIERKRDGQREGREEERKGEGGGRIRRERTEGRGQKERGGGSRKSEISEYFTF